MNWSEHISIEQILLVAFAAGALSMQIRGVAKTVNDLMTKTVPRMHARMDEFKSWQDRHEGYQEGVTARRRAQTHAHGTRVPPEDETPP